jgi:deoxyadenosine/deoxycytidine kinase
MSPPGRPKGESPSAQREGLQITPPGRPKGESPSAQREGLQITPPGRPKGESPSAQREGLQVTPPGRPRDEFMGTQREGRPTSAGRFRHLVVEGPIGVGKTSLARRLGATLGAQLLLEQAQANPFLARFYRDPARHALATQMFFLFQRAGQLAELRQLDLFHSHVVTDFLLDKDRLFARLTLADDELALYEQMYRHLAPSAPAPDLVIYLQASPETLAERVARRGIAAEAPIRADYLRRLADSYAAFFHHYEAAPLLVVNTEHLNPVDRDDDYALLVGRIEAMRGRREYFSLAA